MPPDSHAADRNLLFGIVALQMDFVTRDQLIAAMNAWVLEKHKPLGEIIVAQQALSKRHHDLLDSMVRAHLELHDNDARQSLSALPGVGSIRRSLEPIADAELQRSLHSLHGSDSAPPSNGTALPEESSTASWDGDVLTLTNRYRILRSHAAGGLGEVSLAKDESFDRRIAVKQMQERFLSNPQSRARFLVEAEITGGLDHPFIIPIHGLGFDRSQRPFYAMRFIVGQALKGAVDEFHKSLRHSRLQGAFLVTFQDLLNRFIQVCHAMHYAHERGVIHRDIKPGNIMLGKHGETLVVDWGLAKVVGRPETAPADGEPSLHPSSGSDMQPTATGAAIGTIAYMPPEQAEGRLDEIDRRSDVYALGATLYYLLTGRRQVEEGDTVDPISCITTGAIIPPRQAKMAPGASFKLDIPKPLEAICRKAMALKQPDRYATTHELAKDIQKFLAREPVSAYPENFRERTRRWARKHRTLVTSAGAVLLLALMGSIAFATVVTSKNRDLERQTQRAQAREQMAVDAVKHFCDVVVEDAVLKNNPALEALRKKLLKEPLAFFNSFREQLQADNETRPEALARLAEAAHDYAHLTQEIGDIQDGLRSHVESLAILEKLVRDHPARADYHRGLAKIEDCRGNMLSATGHGDEALESYSKALAIRERLARENPSVTELQRDLAISHNNIGATQGETGHPDQALQSHGKALAIRERLARENPGVTEFQGDLAISHNNIGGLQANAGHPDQALKSFAKALAIQERLARENASVTNFQKDLARSHHNIGVVQSNTGHPDQALASHLGALAIRERLAREGPSVTEFQRDLAISHNNIGILQGETAVRTRRCSRMARRWRSGSGWRARTPASPSSRATWPSAITTSGASRRTRAIRTRR
jgi:serine/threonine-protein kinase